MENKVQSFSLMAKDEILNLLDENREHRVLAFCAALASTATISKKRIEVISKNIKFLEFLVQIARRYLDVDSVVIERLSASIWQVSNEEHIQLLRDTMEDYLDYDSLRGVIHIPLDSFEEEEILQMLRMVFLAVGSLADPNKSYQLAFSIRRKSVMAFVAEILAKYEIEGSVKEDFQNSMLYVKNGDLIANFLGLIGANASYLHFESIRVRKNMNEMVNRAMNFDNANITRVANTAARQIAVIQKIIDAGAFESLPDSLQEMAELRMENPGLSIRELGELFTPALGKSGVNHRLKKLEQWAEEQLEEE